MQSHSDLLRVSLITFYLIMVDHSVFLTGSNGGVWTCGLNTGGQLGQGAIGSSLGAPAMIKLKDTVAVGVAAARYHSVFWTRSGTMKIVVENIQRNSLKGGCHWLFCFLILKAYYK